VFANWLTTAHTQHFLSHICHLTQLGGKASRIEVKDILDNGLLFVARELKAVWSSICAKGHSFSAIVERPALNVKGLSSRPMASELTRIEGLECELYSPFVLE
jgi:hypothetical protein